MGHLGNRPPIILVDVGFVLPLNRSGRVRFPLLFSVWLNFSLLAVCRVDLEGTKEGKEGREGEAI